MTTDAKADAELILRTPCTGAAWAANPGELIPAALHVARAYLAEHPADDGPVTEEWLRAVGFERDGLDWYPAGVRLRIAVRFPMPVTGPREIRLTFADHTCQTNPTRGHVRRLCAALGAPLRAGEGE